MFKKLTAIFLFAAFAIQTFNKAVIVFSYYTNTSAYAKYCENKAKPMMHCNGHCQMMKKLKQEENKDKQNPERTNDTKDEVLFFSDTQLTVQNTGYWIRSNYSLVNDLIIKDVSFSFFRPPQAV